MTISITYTKNEFLKQPVDFRIGAIISDGMWYSLPKWRKMAGCTEDELADWVAAHLADGSLVQATTGAKSFRFPLESVLEWYEERDLAFPGQLTDFIFPPRVWDNMTETEGFLAAPLRDVGIVSFRSGVEVADEIREALLGIARVCEIEPGLWKAYCGSTGYVKDIADEILSKHGLAMSKKVQARRREMVDFTDEFKEGLVLFYKRFGKSLIKRSMDTIKIFLPDDEDRNSQVLLWVIQAIEKFDESKAVPFSGYLDDVLRRWPYDLPQAHLGKELSTFQRGRSKAIKRLKKRFKDRTTFAGDEIATEMGISPMSFADLEDKHRIWMKTQAATTLTWDEKSDEKLVDTSITSGVMGGLGVVSNDIDMAHKLSLAVIDAAVSTNNFDDAYTLIDQMDASEINTKKIDALSADFVRALGERLQK